MGFDVVGRQVWGLDPHSRRLHDELPGAWLLLNGGRLLVDERSGFCGDRKIIKVVYDGTSDEGFV